MPGNGDPPGGGDKPPGLELFKGDDAFEKLLHRYQQLRQQDPSWDFEFVLAKYHEE